MIRSLAHVAVKVSSLDSALDFYCGKLGLEEAFRLTKPDGDVWIVYLRVGNGTFIELFPSGVAGKHAPEDAVGAAHFCIEVDDVSAMVEDLKDRGVQPISGPSIGADNAVQAWFADPDGNRFEFHQYLPSSMQVQRTSL